MKDLKAGKSLLKTNYKSFPLFSTFPIQIMLIPHVIPISIITSFVKHALNISLPQEKEWERVGNDVSSAPHSLCQGPRESPLERRLTHVSQA